MNPVLARLLAERAKHVDYISQLLSRVEEDQRDLVDAETAALNSTKQRIAEIDEQVKPLEEFEQTRAAHEQTMTAITPTVRAQGEGTRLGVKDRPMVYPSFGHFMVDKIRSEKHYSANGEEFAPDPDAVQRVHAAQAAGGGIQTRADQTTTNTPGLLPVTIQGEILETLDGARPFLAALGIKSLSGIPGKVFHRPHITQHTKVAKQTAELTALESQQLILEGIPFTKNTAGGSLRISRQDIDWTDPSAWNIILTDLQAEYAEETDAITATGFEAGITQSETIATANAADVDAWVTALYDAAVKVATKAGTVRASARRLPDTIFTSIDMWGDIGAMLDIAAINKPGMRAGDADAGTFAGSVLRFPRIMVPGLPAGTVVVGRKNAFEFYEERIGLLSAVVPTVLGVEIAYGGYYAYGFLDATAFSKIEII